MKKIPIGKGRFATVDDEDYVAVSKLKWHLLLGRYPARNVNGRKDKRTLFMHHFIAGRPINGMVIDHINGDGTDNRRINLRICTFAENARNHKIRKDNPFGFKGVTRNGKNGFMARIRFDDRVIYIGTFKKVIDAAKAYNDQALKLHGEFACINEL